MPNKLYNEYSIESLSPLEFTRLKPGVYAGNTAYSTQLLVEILSNAVDEFRAGHGDTIKIKINGAQVTVEDNGQGFLVNQIREDGKTVLEAAFSVLNTSGKYRSDGVYEGTSLGNFGIGSKITNFLSHWLIVTATREGKSETVEFNEGVFKSRKISAAAQGSGTAVTWLASEEFFTDPKVEITKVKELLSTLACLCPGLHLDLDYNGEKTNYYSTRGLNDYVDRAVENKELIKNRLVINSIMGKEKIDFVLTYTTNYSTTIIPYVNAGLTERGPHITQIKTLLTREFNKFFRDKKWIKDKEENLDGSDIQEGMYIAFNLTAPDVAYDAQVKTNITKIELKNFSHIISTELQEWLQINEKEIKIIADKALSARKAREAAKKARDAARNDKSKKKEKSQLLNLPTKLVDAWTKDRSKAELLICEGDSAATGLIGARDGETQAVFPIRGKIINLFKNSDEKVFANQEVVNIIKAIGLELDPKTKKLVFDKTKLRYGKIILCCDADPDGEAIKNLLLTYFWSLCPELVSYGYVYAAVPPLFRITTKKNEYIYLRDAAALEDYKTQHQGEKFLVNRSKGLGEQDPEELSQCLLDSDTRNVVQIIVTDIQKTETLFDTFMGISVPPRREYILKHSEEAND